MIDGILFILLIINFGITLTLYFRYHNTRDDDKISEIRKDMTGMIASFNKDAERNIQLLEDKSRRMENLLKRLEATSAEDIVKLKEENQRLNGLARQKILKSKTPGVAEKTVNQMTSLQEIIERVNQNAPSNPAIIKKKSPQTITPMVKKSFVQKAYHSPATSQKKDTPIIKESQPNEPVHEEIPGFQDMDQKEKTHHIARLIGEGRSQEEIAGIIGLSLGETQLITSLLKKRLTG